MKEALLLHLDVGPAGAALRIALGLAFALAVRALLPQAGLVAAGGALLATLFGMKVAGFVGRRASGASPAVQETWRWRRTLASHHDSYQWRKLVWVGLGILLAGLAGPRQPWEAGLGALCVAAGAVAEAVWRRKGLPISPPAAP